MRFLFVLALVSFSSILSAQTDIYAAIKMINPPLFMRNMEGEFIYTPYKKTDASCSFTRVFDNRVTEHLQEKYTYRYICSRKRDFILEIKMDKRRIVGTKKDSITCDPMAYSDFGIKVYTYQKQKKKWHLATLETLPSDFTHKITTTFPHIQKGSELYFYNLDIHHLIEIEYKKQSMILTRNKKLVLKLVWKKNKFCWKE